MRMTRIALVSLLAVIALSGCAKLGEVLGEGGGGHGGKGRMLSCNQNTCPVPITVRNCKVTVDETLDLRTAPDSVVVVWTIHGPGDFNPANGIDFRGNPRITPGPKTQKTWQVTFDNRAKRTKHKYDVNIVGCEGYDPFLMN